ncbi:MAG: hypothetical protein H6564_05885 [Lewinellaceae bacterium]|nr:hypothetical protein [Lewinellaceae bacterium]
MNAQIMKNWLSLVPEGIKTGRRPQYQARGYGPFLAHCGKIGVVTSYQGRKDIPVAAAVFLQLAGKMPFPLNICILKHLLRFYGLNQ